MNYGAIDATAIETDWTEGYGERWESWEAPCCGACGDYAGWDADACEWRCGTEGCEAAGTEVEGYGEGPMMSYRYPLPGFDDRDVMEAAEAIKDLPLCVVLYDGEYALALTGGGMDLSWEICAAYVRLGYLPPVAYAGDLPRYSGGDRIPEILPECREALTVAANRAQYALERFADAHPEEAQA